MQLPQWLLAVSALLALAVVLGVLARRIRLPVTVVLAVVGFVAGTVARRFGWDFPVRGEGFEQTLILGFLPALVFAAVIGTSVRSFMRNLPSVVGLAVVALVIATALVGVGTYALLGVPLAAALLFGALISATDPVAVVAVFRDVGVPQRLLTIVEGESLLNDGVAIVLFDIMLAVALGASASVAAGATQFLAVFFGGAAVGGIIGFAGALALPWLDRLGAAAMSVAVAYGSFMLSHHLLGLSGVMATVAAGLMLAGFAPSRASDAVRDMWEALWEGIDYTANAVLFLLIGLAVDATLLVRYGGAIALAIMLVLVARAAAVVPVVAALERLGVIPRVGKRNEAVLIWGGLRGGVALALALALPEELADRELFVAMTAGVVLATLLLNATTISALVRRLGLATPSRSDQMLAATARLSGIDAARERLDDLGVEDPTVAERLDELERATTEELHQLAITDEEEEQLVVRRGLYVERDTYQHLSDAGLLPAPVARTLLREVDDQIESVTLHGGDMATLHERRTHGVTRLGQLIVSHLPKPPGEDPRTLAYAEATARRLASRRTAKALEVFSQLPNVDADVVARAQSIFQRFEQDAVAELDVLDEHDSVGHHLRAAQADALARVAAADALESLAVAGILPATVAQSAAGDVAGGLRD